MAADPVVRSSVAIADVNTPSNTVAVAADGSIKVSGLAGATFEASGAATAASPSYVEGSVNPLSMNLAGGLRTVSTPFTATTLAATQVTVPATANGILVLASNSSRKGAIVTNAGTATIFLSSAATGLTTSNGFALPAGSSLNITAPLYTGALYGIVATSTQLATTVEFT